MVRRGSRIQPTPDGVPVKMRSPGEYADYRERDPMTGTALLHDARGAVERRFKRRPIH